MASVEDWTPDPKTGRKRYRAHWRSPEGKAQSKVFARRQDAVTHGVRMEATKLDGTYVDLKGGKVAFQVYAREWLAAQTFDESTRESCESRLRNHVYPVLGDRPLLSIRPSVVQAWLRGLSTAASTTKVILGHVSAILDAAVDDGKLPKNPCRARSVRPPARTESKVQPFTEAEVHGIVAAHPAMYGAIPVVAVGLGLRQGESLALAESDIDFLGRWVNVNRQLKKVGGRVVLALPKGRKKRRVPLPEWVGFALAEQIRGRGTHDFAGLPAEPGADNPGGFLFGNTAGSPVRRNSYNEHVWKPALKAIGADLKDRRNGMHRLRHTYASLLLAEGESIAAVSEWLGHADSVITLGIYAHLMPRSEDRTRRVIDSAFGSDGCTTVAPGQSQGG